MTNILARAHRATGDMTAAVVLLRIAFRHQQAVRAGREWTAQSHQDLMGETGCSYDQIRRALSKLRKMEMIETKRGLFANKNVLHFRLTQKAFGLLEQGEIAQIEVSKSAQSEVCKSAQFYVQGETTGSDNMEFSGSSPAGVIRGRKKKDGKGMKVSEVLAAQAAKKHIHKPDTVKQLEFVWKETFAEVYQAGLVHLTKKQLGQLKHFLDKCPEGTAAKVLEWAILNWVEFVKDVETKAGLKTSPSHPSIDFLLKHAWIAVELATATKSPEPKAQKDTGLPHVEVVQLISQDDDDQPKTFEELMAIIGDKPKP